MRASPPVVVLGALLSASASIAACGPEGGDGGAGSPAEPVASATASPYSGTLVFQSDRTGNWDIFLVDADGENLTQLTDDPAADQNPSFSPDGRRIVFSSERTGAGDIYVMDLDGGNLTRLTDHGAYEGAPRFTRDGERILFEGERDGRAQVYVLDLESGTVERVTPGRSRKLGPVESPDGSRLAYMEKGLIWWQVTVMTWADRSEEVVTRGGGSCRPAFAPDGSVLAFVSTRDTPKADVWFREMTGSRAGRAWKVAVRPDAHNYDPSISPDGQVLATASTYDRGPSEQWDLYLSDRNGRNLVRLTGEEGNERFPDWRPMPAPPR